MLELNVKIFQNSSAPINWVLQVSAWPPGGVRPYFFQKDGFATANDAKTFLINNMRMFALQMGNL